MEGQRGVTIRRPAAAAMQPGAEMNETYGMSTSQAQGISQDNSVLNFYPVLSLVMQVWLLIPGHASLIPTYPGLSQSRKPMLGYPGLS